MSLRIKWLSKDIDSNLSFCHSVEIFFLSCSLSGQPQGPSLQWIKLPPCVIAVTLK